MKPEPGKSQDPDHTVKCLRTRDQNRSLPVDSEKTDLPSDKQRVAERNTEPTTSAAYNDDPQEHSKT